MTKVKLKSKQKGEINKFLKLFYNTDLNIYDNLKWEKTFENPIEICDIIGAYIDNSDSFNLSLWVILDKYVLININDTNANDIIKYLFERYPY